jgi:hypothetical protein
MTMAYAIRGESKYRSDYFWLGWKCETKEEAKVHAEREICLRCNTYEIFPVEDETIWIGRKEGFKKRAATPD